MTTSGDWAFRKSQRGDLIPWNRVLTRREDGHRPRDKGEVTA